MLYITDEDGDGIKNGFCTLCHSNLNCNTLKGNLRTHIMNCHNDVVPFVELNSSHVQKVSELWDKFVKSNRDPNSADVKEIAYNCKGNNNIII